MSEPLGFWPKHHLNIPDTKASLDSGDFEQAMTDLQEQTRHFLDAPADFAEHRDHYWRSAWTTLIDNLNVDGLRALYYRLSLGGEDSITHALNAVGEVEATFYNGREDEGRVESHPDVIEEELLKCIKGDKTIDNKNISTWEAAHIAWLEANPRPDANSWQLTEEEGSSLEEDPLTPSVAFCWERYFDHQCFPMDAPSKTTDLDFSGFHAVNWQPDENSELLARVSGLDARWFSENPERQFRIRNVIVAEVEIPPEFESRLMPLVLVERGVLPTFTRTRLVSFPEHLGERCADDTLDKVYRSDAIVRAAYP